MASNLNDPRGLVSPVGKANPLRGAEFHEAAIEFARLYKIGVFLTVDQFDEFCIKHGLNHAPSNLTKGSDAWQAFLQRRFQAKVGLNKAASHPRIQDACPPYHIAQCGHGKLEVKSTFGAAASTKVGRQVESLVETKQTALRHLLQSVDFENLMPAQQAQLQNLHDSIEDYKHRLNFEADRLSGKFERFRHDLSELVNSGRLIPSNGGIKGLLSDGDDQEPDDGNDEPVQF